MMRLHAVLTVALLACAALPARAALELDPRVSYKQDVVSDDAACTWEQDLVTGVVQNAQGAVALAGDAPAASGQKLSLQVVRFETTRWEKKSQYLVNVRADVTQGGKLVGTRDFQTHDTFRNEKGGCDTLKAMAPTLGKEAGKWLSKASFIDCGESCAGIHPDEAIVVGTELPILNAEAVSDAIRTECRFPAKLVESLAHEFNRVTYPPLRARIEPRPTVDLATPRRLEMRVHDMRALGGGGWTGMKYLDMSGELHDGGLTVGSFTLRIEANKYGFGVMRSTCGAVASLSDSAVKLIIQWLRAPSLNATLD